MKTWFKRLFVLILAVLSLTLVGSAAWKYNPFTGQLDYYETGGSGPFAYIRLYDTDSTHYLQVSWLENDTSNRTLGFYVSGGNRTITLTGNPTFGDWFDQNVKTTGTPAFSTVNGLTLTANATGFSVAGGTTSKSLTIELDSAINQDLTSDATTVGFAKVNGLTFTSQLTGFTIAGGTTSKTLTLDADGSASTWNAKQTQGAGLDAINAGTWTGAASITTLGTIGTGGWHATTIAVDHGGTGLTIYAVGDILYASGTGTIAGLNDVATGSYLASGGVNTAPAWTTLNKAAVGLTNVDDTSDATKNAAAVALTNKTGFNGLVVTANTGAITTGSWAGTSIPNTKGGTGVDSSGFTAYPYVTSGTWAADTTITKSAGDVTIAETLAADLVTDGDFATDPTASGWTLNSPWAWDNATFKIDKQAAGTGAAVFTVNLTTGSLYKLVFTVSEYAAGAMYPDLGGANGKGYQVGANGTYTMYIIAAGNNLSFTPTATAFRGSLDDVSLKLVSAGDLTLGKNLNLGMSGQIKFGNGTYYHLIQNSAKEGLAGTDLRIGLDESNRTLILCDRGDLETDLTITAATAPTFIIYSQDLARKLAIANASLTNSTNDFTFNNARQFQFRLTADTTLAGGVFVFDAESGDDLTDTDGQQSFVYIEPKVTQTSTAALDCIYVNPTITSVGDGSTGDGNNLLRLAVAGVTRYKVNTDGIVGYAPMDSTGTPVAPTAALKFFGYNKSTVHDGIIILPTVTSAGFGVITVGQNTERTMFWVDNDGDVTLLNNSVNVEANAASDNKINVGTAGTQEPLQIKNSINATYVINIMFWYD